MNEINGLGNIKKEDVINILDRIIGFVNLCDNKTSVALGIFGVLITILFSSDGVKEIKGIIKSALSSASVYGLLFVILFACTIIVSIFGIIKLLQVLFPQTEIKDNNDREIDSDSKIYFGCICKNHTYKQFREKLINCKDDEYLNDIISQIYINSIICNKKYNCFKVGLKTALIGFGAFLALWGAGIIIY